jgi:hypothetical protein
MIKKESEKVSLEELKDNYERLGRELRSEFRDLDERSSAEIRKLYIMFEETDSKFRLMMEGFGFLDRKTETLEKDAKERAGETEYTMEVIFKKFEEIDAVFKTRFA